jgi:hypothetical protein
MNIKVTSPVSPRSPRKEMSLEPQPPVKPARTRIHLAFGASTPICLFTARTFIST